MSDTRRASIFVPISSLKKIASKDYQSEKGGYAFSSSSPPTDSPRCLSDCLTRFAIWYVLEYRQHESIRIAH
jgi:hypothetical protein